MQTGTTPGRQGMTRPEVLAHGGRRGPRHLRLRLSGAIVGALALLAALFTGLYAWLSLPSYHGSLALDGLEAPVEVIRDAHAIPHIYAKSHRDSAFAMGYAHAQDRLWQMELQRRIGAGRLAELVGEAGLETDFLMRTLGVYRIAERNFGKLSAAARQIYEAYASGVNAYLETRTGMLPLEFQLLRHEPEPWRPADSLVWLKLMAWTLGDNHADELLRARLADRLDRAQLQDLWAQHPDDPEPGPHSDPQALLPAGIDYAALAGAMPERQGSGLGSNSWALSGAHTKSGFPLLANDPHLRLDVPGIWYLAHISTPDFEVAGATLPGLPFPVLGQARNFAWGFTNTAPDVQDLFVERIDPVNPSNYLAPRGSLPFDVRTETIRVRGGEPVRLAVRGTRHGPVISGVIGEDAGFLEAGHVLALSWTALAEDDRSGEALVLATTAPDLTGFVNGLRHLVAPQMNVVFAHREGDIGFVAPGRVPIRAGGLGHLPAPGWTGTHDWVGYIPFDELPRIDNPASGHIVSANHRITPEGYPHFITDTWVPPYRAKRIRELLEGGTRHTVGSLAGIQHDLVSLGARRMLPVLLSLVDAQDGNTRTALRLLGAWNHAMDRDRAEPLIYMAWMRELTRTLFADELGDVFEDYFDFRTEVVHRALTERRGWCDDITSGKRETCAGQVSGALATALDYLAGEYGDDMTGWKWGTAHAVQMPHRLLGKIPVIGSWFEIHMPTGGEKETVKAGGFDVSDAGSPFAQNHGAGYRAVYDLADPGRSVFITSTGQSGNPLSPRYRDYAEPWRDGQYLPMLTDRARIAENSLGSLVLTPK